jgi:cytochrome c oxidase assembly factor CtaG
MWALLRIALFLMAAAPAQAHAPAAPGDDHVHLPWTWNADPLVLVPVLTLGLLYGVGILRLWSRAGAGHGVPVWRVLACAVGIVALFAALISPLDAAAEASFALHMAQHMLLVVVAAPLIVLGNCGVVALTALPGGLRVPLGRTFASAPLRRVRAWLFAVLIATAVHGLTLWLWHAPRLYEAALADPLIHYLEHLTMFGTAVVFWWSALGAGRRAMLGYGAAVVALFLTMLHSGLLGILITLAPAPLYPSYAAAPPWLGLAPLEDQQLAGIVMLLPGGLAYLAGGLALLAAWLAAAEARTSAAAPRAADWYR